MNSKEKFKIVMAGDSCVGKTSLIERFYQDTFNEAQNPTVSPGLFRVRVQLPDQSIMVNIWDTAGQEKFSCMVPIYTRNANGIILVFDLTSPESFRGAQHWYNYLSEDTQPGCQIILCGNKNDLPTNFDVLEAEEWARSHDIPFVKVSAKSAFGVKELFQMMTQMIYDVSPVFDLESPVVQEIISGNDEKQSQKKCSC